MHVSCHGIAGSHSDVVNDTRSRYNSSLEEINVTEAHVIYLKQAAMTFVVVLYMPTDKKQSQVP